MTLNGYNNGTVEAKNSERTAYRNQIQIQIQKYKHLCKLFP